MTVDEQKKVIRIFIVWLEDTETFSGVNLSTLLQAEQDYIQQLDEEDV